MCFTYKRYGNITSVNNGLFYYGPSYYLFSFTILLLVSFTVLAFGPGSPHPAVSVIGFLWGTLCLYYLLRCGLSDPGIIPRRSDVDDFNRRRGNTTSTTQTQEQNNNNNNNTNSENQNSSESTPAVVVPKHQEVIVECKNPLSGKIVPKSMELTWCYTCNIQRPLRASHCKWSDCCIDRMDHFCPWTGTCVGERNYRYFFGFVVSTSFYACYMIGTMAYSLKIAYSTGVDMGKKGSDAFFEGLGEKFHYLPLVCLIVAAITLCLVGGLAFYHCGLTSTDVTTHEDLRRYYWQLQSPFDRGSCTKNCGAVLCDPRPEPIDESLESGKANEPRNMVANANTVVVDTTHRAGRNNNANRNRSNTNNNNNNNNNNNTTIGNQQQMSPPNGRE